MGLRGKFPVTLRPKGVSDAQDGTNAFPGAMAQLSNLVMAYHTDNVFVPRPAAEPSIDFANFSSPAVDLNFSAGTYQSLGVIYSLTSLPGFAYSRTGTELVVDSDGSVDSFAANVAPVNGYGYHAYGALTNQITQSTPTTWANDGHATTLTANSSIAPDGTNTASLFTAVNTGGSYGPYFYIFYAATGSVFTTSMFVKAGTGRYFQLRDDHAGGTNYANFDLQTGVVTASSGLTAAITALPSGWYRLVLTAPVSASGSSLVVFQAINSPTAPRAQIYVPTGETYYVWGAVAYDGINLTSGGGGPVIPTSGATASIGAPTFTVNVPNGTWPATYTFDDNSTQIISTVVSGGAFTLPTYPTLNRPRVKEVKLAVANSNGVISEFIVVGSRVYGMVSSTLFPGKDEPFCYDLSSNTFISILGVISALLPASQNTTGEWVPPVLRAINNVTLILTHSGFPGGVAPGVYFGWIDTSSYSQSVIGNTVNGSNVISSLFTTIGNSAPILQGVQPGQLITSPNFPAGTYVLSCANGAFSLNTTGNTHSNTTLDGLASTTGVQPGMTVSGPGIPSGTYVTVVVSSSQVTLSQAAIATSTGVAINFAGGGSITVSANATVSQNVATISVTGGTPNAPRWGAGNTNTNALTVVPKCCYGFNGRCYFGSGSFLVFSDPSLPLQVSLATQAIQIGDNTDITALAGVPLTSQLTGGVQQSMTIFKGAGALWQVTGDAASGNLATNVVAGSVGTLAPRSIVGTPNGTTFLAVDGLRVLGLSGTLSEPINTQGGGVAVPFLNALFQSRIVAAYAENIYRATVQDASLPGNPLSEYWLDINKNVWTGPHSLPTRAAQAYTSGASFLVAPFNVNGQLWQSDAIPNFNSTYIENGSRLQCSYRTVLLPDNQQARWNKASQGTLAVALSSADSVNVSVDDDRGNTLGTCAFNGASSAPSSWGSFLWGAGSWGSPTSLLREYFLKFPNQLVFRQARVTATFQAAASQAIGNLYFALQPMNLNDL